MRKYIAILLIIMMPILNISSADEISSDSDSSHSIDHSSATFEILGYKVDRSLDITFEITDALSESLDVIGDAYSNIELDNHIDQLLGDYDDKNGPSDPRNQIIFSYRVTGRGNENSSNSYHVDFSFHPFFRYEDNTQDNTSWINASYMLTNLSYSFPDYTSDEHAGISIKKSTGTSTDIVVINGTASTGTLSSHWTVSGVDAPLWMHRGAIALTLDSGTSAGGYNNPDAKFGLYKAEVTATLYGP